MTDYSVGTQIPSGFIGLWSGSIASIPEGWALCNGASGTPDLRDRFIVGARQDDGGLTKSNVEGFLAQTGGTAFPQQSVEITTSAPSATKMTSTVDGSALATGSHTHTWSGFTNDSFDPLTPPYYALAYIMKL